MALAGEVGELVAEFQWLTPEESANLTEPQRARVSSEIADVMLYLLQLADCLTVDLIEEAHRKVAENASRYTVEEHAGNARKEE